MRNTKNIVGNSRPHLSIPLGLALIILSLFQSQRAHAQIDILNFIKDNTRDSTYVISYDKFFIGRVFLSRKFTRLDLIDRNAGARLQFRPNSTLNLGVGVTYGLFSVSISQGFSFLNPENQKGETRWLDLQTRVYGRRYIADLYGQFYNGFYLLNSDAHGLKGYNPDGDYYLREDIRLRQLGLSFMYIFNSEKYSYRSSFTHNEWQQASAGSLLLGLETYGGYTKSDSSMIPFKTIPEDFFGNIALREVSYYEIGPSVGYAHTLVYRKKWFATAHLSANLSMGWVTEMTDQEKRDNFGLYPNFLFRGVVGYNSPRWFAGASIIRNNLLIRSSFGQYRYQFETGDIRLTLAMRFVPSAGTKRYLRILDDLGLAPKE